MEISWFLNSIYEEIWEFEYSKVNKLSYWAHITLLTKKPEFGWSFSWKFIEQALLQQSKSLEFGVRAATIRCIHSAIPAYSLVAQTKEYKLFI